MDGVVIIDGEHDQHKNVQGRPKWDTQITMLISTGATSEAVLYECEKCGHVTSDELDRLNRVSAEDRFETTTPASLQVFLAARRYFTRTTGADGRPPIVGRSVLYRTQLEKTGPIGTVTGRKPIGDLSCQFTKSRPRFS